MKAVVSLARKLAIGAALLIAAAITASEGLTVCQPCVQQLAWLDRVLGPTARQGARACGDKAAQCGGAVQSATELRASARPGYAAAGVGLFSAMLLMNLVGVSLSNAPLKPVVPAVTAILNLVGGIVIIVLGVRLVVESIAALMLMFAVMLIPLFGPIIYLAAYGSFPRGAVATLLSATLGAKVVTLVCIGIGNQGYLKIPGTLLFFLLSIFAGIAVTWLHALPPSIAVSIFDAVGGAVLGVVAAIVALVFGVIGGIISLIIAIVGLFAAATAKLPDVEIAP